MEELTYDAFVQGCKELAKRVEYFPVDNMYGIPRGGTVVAVYLSHLTSFPVVEKDKINEKTLIVDDIVDSGKTMARYEELGYYIATLYYHKECGVVPDVWVFEKTEFVKFPWETESSAKIDYDIQRIGGDHGTTAR